MKIERIDVIHTEIPLNQSFKTSFGEIKSQHSIVTKVYSDGLIAYGEACPFFAPVYSYECIDSIKLILDNFIIPVVLKKDICSPQDFLEKISFIKGHNHAKAALETALWDLKSKQEDRPLWKLLKGEKSKVEVGVSIGIQPNIDVLLEKINQHLEEGYNRIKIKIEPGMHELKVLKIIREKLPSITLMVDANSSYTLDNLELFKQFDKYNLLMIEQPLGESDLIDHSDLQKHINTPICLDESICSFDDARKAAKIKSCRIINIKYGRVGGLFPALKIHDMCFEERIGNWIGGMIETGIGQRFKIALSTLKNVKYASDIETSNRFLLEDIVEPNIVQKDGFIDANIIYQINEDKLNYYTKELWIYK